MASKKMAGLLGAEETISYPTTDFNIIVDSLSYEWEVTAHQLSQNELRSKSFQGELPNVHWRMQLTAKEPLTPSTELFLSVVPSCSREIEVYVVYHFLINSIRLFDNQFHCSLRDGKRSTEFLFPIDTMFPINKGEVSKYHPASIVLSLSQELSFAKYYDPPNSLESSFGQMLNNRKFTDIVVETEDGIKLPVHQAVLYARSAVFRAMLENDMQETKTKCIPIPDFSSETVTDMVTYLYTGRIPKFRCDSAAALLKAAEKYDLPDLKFICSENLSLNLWVHNAVQFLLLADTFRDDDLKEKALKFIADHRKSFEDTSSFELVEHSRNILLDIIGALAKQQNQY